MIKKFFIFSLVLISSLGFFGMALAEESSSSPTLILPNPLSGVGSFADLIANITSYIAGIIGTLAILMFVIAGIQFVVSGGNAGKVDQAKKTAIWAAVGTGIALAGAGLIELVKVVIGYSS